jgi:hypothetical protein
MDVHPQPLAADWGGGRLGVIAHRPAHQLHDEAVRVSEEPCDGAERIADQRAEQRLHRWLGAFNLDR